MLLIKIADHISYYFIIEGLKVKITWEDKTKNESWVKE